MTPEPLNKSIDIGEIVTEIDQRPFIQTLTSIVSEVSPRSDTQKIHSLIKRAIRCACLLDLYAETDDPIYKAELEKQRSKFYEEVPEGFHLELKKVEDDVKRFFDNEQILIERISAGDKFSNDDIRNYLMGKSGDNLFYGRLLELLVPEWNLTNELRIQTMLFDIGKDLVDYGEDVTNGLPNILGMCLSSGIDKSKIIQLARELKDEAFASQNIRVSPTLIRAIEQNYSLIKERLEDDS